MKKKEAKKLTKDQAIREIDKLKKDLFNMRFKKINGQLQNVSEYSSIKKNIARLYNNIFCLLYTSPSPRDISGSRMPSSA